eukprot:948157-Prorocentrum_minimum.AAC.2
MVMDASAMLVDSTTCRRRGKRLSKHLAAPLSYSSKAVCMRFATVGVVNSLFLEGGSRARRERSFPLLSELGSAGISGPFSGVLFSNLEIVFGNFRPNKG